MKIRLQITDEIPKKIEEGILYVSFKYWTTAHKCGCGCGQKVVLRLSPKHWTVMTNGESVSMYPSVGNWQLPCRSHYWIEEGRIVRARRWSDAQIKHNRAMTRGRRSAFPTMPRFLPYPLAQIENDHETDPHLEALSGRAETTKGYSVKTLFCRVQESVKSAMQDLRQRVAGNSDGVSRNS